MKEILILVFGGLITLAIKLVYDKIRGKSVKLFHHFDAPAEFPTFPPTTIFQNLTIKNDGNLPATGIQIFLKSNVIDSKKTEYKPVTEDKFEVERRDDLDIIRVETTAKRKSSHFI